jgi:hypothetical protein
MKRIVLVIFAAFLLTTGHAQTVKEVRDSVKAATKSGNLKTMASTVKGAFAAKSAEAEQLVDTWVYVEPAVLSTSNRMLRKMAGNAVAGKVEKMIDDYYERANVTPENTYYTFHSNGTYSRSLAGKTISGNWMTAGEHVLLAVKNVQVSAMTSHLENDTLMLVADLSKTLGELQKLGGFSDTKTNNTLLKLAKNIKGLKIGFLLARRKQEQKGKH